MNTKLFVVLSILLSVMIAACAITPRIDSGSVAVENKDFRAVMVFGEGDREKISRYYKSRMKRKTVITSYSIHYTKLYDCRKGDLGSNES